MIAFVEKLGDKNAVYLLFLREIDNLPVDFFLPEAINLGFVLTLTVLIEIFYPQYFFKSFQRGKTPQ